jgi:hypothetical protein
LGSRHRAALGSRSTTQKVSMQMGLFRRFSVLLKQPLWGNSLDACDAGKGLGFVLSGFGKENNRL